MRRRTIALTLGVLATSSAGACGDAKSVSLEVHAAGQELLRCDHATMVELSPAEGGWAFKCDDGSSVYVVYETDDTPARGTVEEVQVTPSQGEATTFASAIAIGDQTAGYCATVPSYDVGPPPLTLQFGRVAKGAYVLSMARPCVDLELVVGKPR